MGTEQVFEDWLQEICPVRRRARTVRDVLKHAQLHGIDPQTLDCPVRPEHKLRPGLASGGLVKCKECDFERTRRRRAKKPTPEGDVK